MKITGIDSRRFASTSAPYDGVSPPRNSAEHNSTRSAPPAAGLDGIVERPAADFQLDPSMAYLTFHSWMPAENVGGRTAPRARSAVVVTGVKRTVL